MDIAFIGLGSLGRAIAERLIESGFELVVWNRHPERAQGLKAEVAESPAAAARSARVVALCLADSDAVDAVLDPGGLLDEVGGKLVIDFTTHHFERVLRNHERVEAQGGRYLESPVAGSVVPARQGELVVLCSGPTETVSQAKPVLDVLSRKLFHFVEPCVATRLKLVNNLVLGSFMATLAEATALGEASGLDRETVLEVLAEGGGKSLVLDAKRNKLLQRDYAPHFSVAMICKDLRFARELADELGRGFETGAVSLELFERAAQRGLAASDFASVVSLFEPPAGPG
jgi:3-hydroxyisobutyrate dehydrogenase